MSRYFIRQYTNFSMTFQTHVDDYKREYDGHPFRQPCSLGRDARNRRSWIHWRARVAFGPRLAVIGFGLSWPSLSPAGAIEQRARHKN